MAIVREFLTIFVPLTIIMDPFGNLPLFLLFTSDNTPDEQKRTARISTLAAGMILLVFALTGDIVLRFFGISLPAFQITGGLIFLIYALQMLHLLPSGLKTSSEEEEEGVAKENAALVPLATPLIAGPGAITAVLVRDHAATTPMESYILMLAILASCLTVYCVFFMGPRISRLLGVSGIRVITRLMGLLLAVIAVQFMVDGFKQL